jgi:hypothetical protein
MGIARSAHPPAPTMQPGLALATRVLAAKPASAAKPARAAVAPRDGPMTAKRKA